METPPKKTEPIKPDSENPKPDSEFARFDGAINQLLAVPRDVFQKRLEKFKASRESEDQSGKSNLRFHGPVDPP